MFSFNFYKVKSIKDYVNQREKREGLKNLFLEKIDQSLTRDEKLNNLVKQLEKQGFKIVRNKRKKDGN